MTSRKYICFITLICGFTFTSCTKHANIEAQAWYEQGKELREAGNQTEAMEMFLRVVHSRANDHSLLGRVYSNMANMCRQANEHTLAYRVYTLSAEQFSKSGDTLAYAYALNNMAWEQAVMGSKESSLMLIDSAVRVCSCSDLTDKVRESHAAACLFAKEYDSVLFYSVPPASDYLLMVRAQAYSWLQQNDSATYYAQQLLPRMTNPFYLDDIYYILTYNDTAADKETILSLASRRADAQNTIKTRHGQLKQAVQLLEQDLERKETAVPWCKNIAIFLVLLIITSLFYYLFLRKKRKEQHIQKLQQFRETMDVRQDLEWKNYSNFLQETNRRFFGLAAWLQAQGLNEQDIRICILTLIGISHKDMADLLICSPNSIGKQKDLTAHKLGVSGGQLQKKLQETYLHLVSK